MGLGDSEMDGRGLLEDAPVGYPPTDGSLLMVKDPAAGAVPLQEPLSHAWQRMGPLGLFGWKRLAAVDSETSVCVVNGGVGGSKSSEYLPGSGHFNNLVAKARAALNVNGASLAGIVLFNGLNDATVSPAPDWEANSAATIAALKQELGDAPVFVVRYPATVPLGGGPYPSHAELRDVIGSASFADEVIDAPEGPFVEAEKVHLATSANEVVAESVADAAR